MSSNTKPDAGKAKEQTAFIKCGKPTSKYTPNAGDKLYCICAQENHGTMIACDNEACELEWFHLSFVGLSDLPPRKSQWFCPSCCVKVGKGVLTDGIVGGNF